ncbi:MAG: sulfatase-like hydrolase/transferase [Acidobacteriota bacterium]
MADRRAGGKGGPWCARGPAFIALLLAQLGGLSACRRPPQPNVLLITVDTTRADHLGCYGYGLARTPAIDALAAEGVRCTNASTAAPITLPSHATILTGVLPPAHGVRDNGAYALGDEAVTLAERLKAAGYDTQAFVSAMVLDERYNLDQGFDGYDDDLWSEDQPKLFMIRDRPAWRTADRVLKWLERWSARPDRRRFFLWVHLFDPHQPCEPPAKFRVLCPTPYDGEIAAADEAVGKIVADLRRRGILDQTLVVLCADHGESLGEHQEKTHALFIYDATIRIPLILRYPALLAAGTLYRGSVRTVDIIPTMLGMLRLPGGGETQGVNLIGAFQGKSAAPVLPQYCESLLSEVGFGMAPLYGVRLDGYKWIRAPKPELYDYRRDQGELHNLCAAEQSRSKQLDGALQALIDDCRRFAVRTEESPMDRETEEMLRSLGYLASAGERKSMGGMDPKDGIGIYNKLEDARHLAQQREWAEAERLLREILDVIPEHISARGVLGLCLLRQGRFEEARAQYLRLLADDPGQFRVYGTLGGIALAEGDLAEAERFFKQGIEINGSFVEAMANIGFIETLRGNDEAAKAWYAKATDADPAFPRTQRLLGDLYYERSKFGEALEFYKKALGILPGDFQATIQAGNCARRIGDRAGARRYFERAGEIRPDSWIPPYNLACLEAASGDIARAMGSLAESVKRGLQSEGLLREDRDLDPLRALPEFKKLLAGVAQSAGAEAKYEGEPRRTRSGR